MDQLVVGGATADEQDETHEEAQALQAHAAHPLLVDVVGCQDVADVGHEGVQQRPLQHLNITDHIEPKAVHFIILSHALFILYSLLLEFQDLSSVNMAGRFFSGSIMCFELIALTGSTVPCQTYIDTLFLYWMYTSHSPYSNNPSLT